MSNKDEYGRGQIMVKIDDWIESHPVLFVISGMIVYIAAHFLLLGGWFFLAMQL